ncbi:MAG: ABC transporter substrate-binding protein [Candidatus Bathyanammoxibius sp.]
MRRKTAWLILGCLIVAALVLASCSSDTDTDTDTDTPTDTATDTPVAPAGDTGAEMAPGMVIDSLGRTVEEPQYGGEIRVQVGEMQWDIRKTGSGNRYHADLQFEVLMFWDWTKGPSGTGEIEMKYAQWYFPIEEKVGGLAESWERIDLLTAVYHIRPGVMWQDGSLLNGRELTADDVVYSMDHQQAFPSSLFYKGEGEAGITATALDKYTVEFKRTEPSPRAWEVTHQELVIIPPEIEEAGLDWDDWHTYIETGTGPYTVDDVVTDVSLVLTRNPNYWEFDPLQPENRLPYPDSIKGIYIADQVTAMANLRAGQLERVAVEWADKAGLIKTNPELLYFRGTSPDQHIRFNVTNEMFDDKRVRQALIMALDRETIIRDLYDGDAEWYIAPALPAFKDIYVPFEELPAEIKEIYTYDPEKAKQRLADAGYPNGLQFTTVVQSNDQDMIDLLTVAQTYYEAIDVDMTIDTHEAGEFWGMLMGGTHEAAAGVWGITDPWTDSWILADPGHWWNDQHVDDAAFTAAYNEIGNTFDPDEQNRLTREVNMTILDEAWFNLLPSAPSYVFIQPWLKNYNGEYLVGAMQGGHGSLKYAWIDQELKTEMGQ